MARAGPIFIAGFALVLGACKSAPSCPTQVRTDPGRALSDYQGHRGSWRSLKAEARVTQWADRGRIRGNVLMFLEQPNRVRFDVMTQLGPGAVLTSDGESFQLSDFREGVFLHGPTCPQNVARLLGVSIGAEEILGILTGNTPTLDAIAQSMECRDGLYVVTLVAADRSTQEVAFSVRDADRQKPPEEQTLQLRRSVERGPDGARRWEARYDDYVDVDGQSFPTHVRFIDAVNDAETTVRVKSITLNPDIPDGTFRQAPSPGMSIELASCS